MDLPAGASYIPDVIDPDLQDDVWRELTADPDVFGASQIFVDGEWHEAPRLVASFADVSVLLEGMQPSRPWPEALDRMRKVVSGVSQSTFNYALANLYRHGDDFAGWHADKASLHNRDSLIAIVSLGAVRTLEFRESDAASAVIDLEPGSVVIMELPLQDRYEHRIPPTTTPVAQRISVTLRSIPLGIRREVPGHQ